MSVNQRFADNSIDPFSSINFSQLSAVDEHLEPKEKLIDYMIGKLAAAQQLSERSSSTGSSILGVLRKIKEREEPGFEQIRTCECDASLHARMQAHVEIAKVIARLAPDVIGSGIRMLGLDVNTIEGKEGLQEILKIIVSRRFGKKAIWSLIENFGVKKGSQEGKQILNDMIELIGLYSPHQLISFIEDFEIDCTEPETKARLLETAKTAASKDFLIALEVLSLCEVDIKSNEGRSRLIELFKIAAEEKKWLISEQITSSGADAGPEEMQKILSGIAIAAAENCNVRSIFEFSESLGLDINAPEGQRTLIEMAERIKKNNEDAIFSGLEYSSFDKSSAAAQKVLEDIAKITAEKDPSVLAEYIEELGFDGNSLEGQKVLIEIAQTALKRDPFNFDRLVKKMNVNAGSEQGQQFLVKLALMAVEEDPKTAGKAVKKLGIDVSSSAGAQGLIEIAEKLAGKNEIFTFVEKCGIDRYTEAGQKILIQIADIAALHDPAGTFINFSDFGIDLNKPEGLQCLLELVKNQFQTINSLMPIFDCLKKLNINPKTAAGQRVLIETAKVVAQHIPRPYTVALEINKFRIDGSLPQGQKGLREIARVIIQRSPADFSNAAGSFGFKDNTLEGQLELIEFAKAVALADPARLLYCYQALGINGRMPETRQEIMKLIEIIAWKDFSIVLEFFSVCSIDAYSEDGQNTLIKLFKMTAEKNGWVVPEEIKNYEAHAGGEERQKVLTEIVKTIAREGSSQFIFKFAEKLKFDFKSAEGQETWVEVIKTLAKQNPNIVYESAWRLGIDGSTALGQKRLIEIAKICAERAPGGIVTAVKDFGIDSSTDEGQKAIIEIAAIAIKNSPDSIVDVSRLPIESPLERLKLFALIVHRVSESQFVDILASQAYEFFNFIEELQLPKTEPYISTLNVVKAALRNRELSENIKSLQQFVNKRWPELSIDKQLNYIQNIKNAYQKQECLNWLTSLMFSLSAHDIDQKKMMDLSLHSILDAVLSLRNPQMRYVLSDSLVRGILSNHETTALFIQMNQAGIKQHFSILTNLLLANLGLDSVTSNALAEKINSMKGESGNSSLFDDYRALNVMLSALQGLGEASELSPPDKASLLSLVFDLSGRPLIDSLRAVKGISNFKYEIELQSDRINALMANGQTLDQVLDSIFLESFQKLVPIHLSPDEFSSRFEKTLGQPRTYQAVLAYAATLNRLSSADKKLTTDLFAEYVEKVLEGTFEIWRYEGLSDHLTAVFTAVPGLKEKWIANERILLTDLLQTMSSGPSLGGQVLNFELFLKNAFGDNHISQEDYPTLYAFLKADSQQEKIRLSKLATHEATKNLKNLTPEEQHKALFEREAITLCSAKNILGQEKALLKIIGLKGLPEEFKHDVRGWREGIAQSKKWEVQSYEGWTVEFTDNPSDLILCGTEVAGSCQRVDGSPELSKCLLAYLADGKNKLLAVKDGEGKIRARAILRLLIDDNTKMPVLFLERIYPAVVSEDIAGALIQMAKKQKSRLELPLLTENGDLETKYNGTLSSLGGIAPFEYSDSSGGVFPNSQFTVSEAYPVR